MPASIPDIESVLRRFEKAAAPLLRKSLESSAKAPKAVLHAQVRGLKSLRRQQQEHSKAWSKFLFEHASDFNRIVRAHPDFVPRGLERRLPFMPASLDRIRAEMIIIDRLFDLRHVKPNPCLTTQPVIYAAAGEWLAGDTNTITGTGFGPAAGTVVLHLDTPRGNAFPPRGTTIPLTVLDWSDSAARVQVPTALPPGIPLSAGASLTLTRADVSCSDTLGIVFKPPHIFLSALSPIVAASGTAGPGTPYSRTHTFTSPVLPPRAEPHLFGPSITPWQDVTFSQTSIEFRHGGDDAPSFTSPGPSFSSTGARTISITVSDDWAWNYSLQVKFNIIQPADEVTGAGWSVTP